jgi:hypothetical protein
MIISRTGSQKIPYNFKKDFNFAQRSISRLMQYL